MSKQITNNDKKLFNEIKQLIEEAQNTVVPSALSC